MTATGVLARLVSAVAAGQVRIVDLRQTLSPGFLGISLPPEPGQCLPFRVEEISRYDERGQGWHWNNFPCGEHTSTHFDASVHWISGHDIPNHATDTIAPRDCVGAACVIDCSKESAVDPVPRARDRTLVRLSDRGVLLVRILENFVSLAGVRRHR